VNTGQRGGDPALLLLGVARQLVTRDVFEQRQRMLSQDEPSVRRGNRSSRDEPRVSECRGDLASRDELCDRGRRDAFGDVRRSSMLDQPRL
jgi:hypothetical protein